VENHICLLWCLNTTVGSFRAYICRKFHLSPPVRDGLRPNCKRVRRLRWIRIPNCSLEMTACPSGPETVSAEAPWSQTKGEARGGGGGGGDLKCGQRTHFVARKNSSREPERLKCAVVSQFEIRRPGSRLAAVADVLPVGTQRTASPRLELIEKSIGRPRSEGYNLYPCGMRRQYARRCDRATVKAAIFKAAQAGLNQLDCGLDDRIGCHQRSRPSSRAMPAMRGKALEQVQRNRKRSS